MNRDGEVTSEGFETPLGELDPMPLPRKLVHLLDPAPCPVCGDTARTRPCSIACRRKEMILGPLIDNGWEEHAAKFEVKTKRRGGEIEKHTPDPANSVPVTIEGSERQQVAYESIEAGEPIMERIHPMVKEEMTQRYVRDRGRGRP